MVEKVLLMRKNLVAMLFRRLMQRSQRSISSCGQTGEWWDKCLHEFGRHVEKWNTNVWRFKTRLLVGLVHFSPLTHNAVQQCVNGYTYPQIFFHNRVAPPFYFFHKELDGNIPTGTPQRGRRMQVRYEKIMPFGRKKTRMAGLLDGDKTLRICVTV